MDRKSALLAALAIAALPASARADWHQPVGGASPINQSATRAADAVWLTPVGGVPFVAWNEDTTQQGQGSSSQIRVARLSSAGTSWEKVGNAGTNPISRLASTSSHNPTLADLSGVPWVSWSEGITPTDQEIRVARLDASGTAWTRVVDTTHPINHVRTDPGAIADYPTIVDGGQDRPYVSFFEADPGTGSNFFPNSNPAQIWVDRLNAAGTGWDEVGGGPVSDPSLDAAFPRMAMVGGTPWLAYFQLAMVNNNPALTIAAAHLSNDGQSWVHLPPLAAGGFSQFTNPSIASVGGRPVIAFGDKGSGSIARVHVLRLNAGGTGWDDLGFASGTGSSADGVSLGDIQGEPWVAWRTANQGPSQVQVARLTGGSWQAVGGQINDDANHGAQAGPALASINGFPWVAFGENDVTQNTQPPCCGQVRVSRLEPDFGAASAEPGSTDATLLATASHLYGLPFPVGFQFGQGSGLGSSTPTGAVSGDPGAVFREIGGLTPSTLYSYRPFATAGTPLPLATGPTGFFVTRKESPAGPTGAQGPAGPTGSTGPQGPAGTSRLVAAILQHAERIRRGRRLVVRFFVSDDVTASLTVLRGGKQVQVLTKDVNAGAHTFKWPVPATAATGRYKLLLRAVDPSDPARRIRDGDEVRVSR